MTVWYPEKGIMQIESIGSIEIKDNRLTLLPDGNSVPVIKDYLGHYIMLYQLLHDKLEYDELWGIRDSIDTFFESNGISIGKLSNFPTIYNDMDHGVTYKGISCNVPQGSSYACMWYYLLYKKGD